jgi:D-threonine aldolase
MIGAAADVQGLHGVATPALLVNLDVLDANIAAAARLFGGTDIRLRPHVKTHRCPELARLQLTAVTNGVACATVAEAALMISAGIRDVLIANEIVAPSQLVRVAQLARIARLAVVVDSPGPIHELSRRCVEHGAEVDVLVDVDVGLRRCGVRDPQEALALARDVVASPGVHLRGLMGYEGRLRSADPQRAARLQRALARLSETKACFEAAGLAVPVVSGGGTSTMREALSGGMLTEVQAGTYAFMEGDLDGLGLPFSPAVSVLTTTISRGSDRFVLDAGWKALGCEYGNPEAIGIRARVERLGEEHVVLRLNDPQSAIPAVGDRLLLRASHVGMTFALHQRAWLIRAGRVESCAAPGIPDPGP